MKINTGLQEMMLLLRQYATIQALDETVLNYLISRILVDEGKEVDGQKTQKVRIVYDSVGEVLQC